MLPISLQSSRLDSLQSSDELGLLDAIDELRSQGVSHYVSLPRLIVCGDQSSGKSSVLEAISGVPFPTKDNLCTRFATELILRRTSTVGLSITIVPSQDRSEAERARLSGFRETMTSLDDLPELIEKANEFMDISAAMNAFSNDVLRIEISGTDRPHLTIVDLPGLIHSEKKMQTSADVSLVLSMVKSYMANRRSIILAVVSAKNDYANQIVTKLAKDVDTKGHRTLGIITKPDTLPVGSESEAAYANLAKNEDVEFRLGWHVLRNRDYETRNASIEARDKAEDLFFSQSVWRDFPRNVVGITSLRPRLSKIEIAVEKLGTSRTTLDERRLFLLNASQSFQSITKAALDGTYGDPFFGQARTIGGSSKRLRAVVQSLNMDFAENLRTHGHQREIIDRYPPSGTSSSTVGPQLITRADFLDEVTDILKRSQGRELPGMFSPLIVGDLFHEQSHPWERLAQLHLKAVWEAAHVFLELIVAGLTNESTAEALLREVIDPLMEDVLQDMTAKLGELVLPYQRGHPITYNHYFTETIQNMRKKRIEAEVATKLNCVYGKDVSRLEQLPSNIRTTHLISTLANQNEADMDRYASSEVLDCMQAYYKVAIKSFVDSVTIYVVEIILVGSLEKLLSPASVLQMKPDLIGKIAAETLNNRLQREQLGRKLIALRAGIETCKRHVDESTTKRKRRAWHTELQMPSPNKSDIGVQDSASQITKNDGHDIAIKPLAELTTEWKSLSPPLLTASPLLEPEIELANEKTLDECTGAPQVDAEDNNFFDGSKKKKRFRSVR